MNKTAENKYKLPEQGKDNPFSVPEGYFNSFPDKLKERMREQESRRAGEQESRRVDEHNRSAKTIWLRISPHLALAAAITGFALISFTLLRILIGSGNVEESYDLSFLDETGILNESVFQETLEESEIYTDEDYTEWEIEAMEYLASNEVNLEALLYEK